MAKKKSKIIPIQSEEEMNSLQEEKQLDAQEENAQEEDSQQERLQEIDAVIEKKGLKVKISEIVSKVRTFFAEKKVSSLLEKTVDKEIKKFPRLNREALLAHSAETLSQFSSSYSEEGLLELIRHRLLFQEENKEENKEENMDEKITAIVEQFDINGEEKIEQTVQNIVSKVSHTMMQSLARDDELNQLREKVKTIDKLEEEVRKKNGMLKNIKQDYDRLKSNTEKTIEDIKENANRELMDGLLHILDMFNNGLQSKFPEDMKVHIKGFEMIYNHYYDTLKKFGLEEQKALGEEFDPDHFDGLFVEPTTEHPDNKVIEVFEKGYVFKGKLLRHAKVKVSKNPDWVDSKDQEENKE